MGIFIVILLIIGLLVRIWFFNQKTSSKGKINRTIVVLLIGGILCWGLLPHKKTEHVMQSRTSSTQHVAANEAETNETNEVQLASSIQLDVPLLNQMDEPSLYNGCEVTSLAMLLNYIGMDVSKNELADKVATVPFEDEAGKHGDPREGFVGDITGVNPGYSVYSAPMIDLASQYVRSEQIVDLSEQDFDKILAALSQKQPVWCITTVTFAETNDMETWETAKGSIDISWNVHSVLITGFDKEHIFLNDPYGEKRAVDRDDFIAAWHQMGEQAFTIKSE